MEKVAIRSQYKTKNTICDGYICIDNNIIEGVFGLDYIKIDIIHNKMNLYLYENTYTIQNGFLQSHLHFKNYTSKNMYSSTLYCPEIYILSSENYNEMLLDLIECEKNVIKLQSIFEELDKVKSRFYFL